MDDEAQKQKLRNVTVIIKAFPFAYSVVLIILALCDWGMPNDSALTMALICYATLPAAALCFGLSYFLKLCNRYRIQCCIMLLPLLVPYWRIHQHEEYLIWIRLGVIIILFMSVTKRIIKYSSISGYKKFKSRRDKILPPNNNN